VRREKEERDYEIRGKKEENRQAQILVNKANGIWIKKERKRLEQEKRAAENKRRAGLPPITRRLRNVVEEATHTQGK
jgi:hypothetical protein